MIAPEQDERIERNVQRTVGGAALKQISRIVDEDLEKEAAGARMLRAFLRYGWIILLVAAALLAHYLGVI
jgi:gamma-glutamylcysteine synthetase